MNQLQEVQCVEVSETAYKLKYPSGSHSWESIGRFRRNYEIYEDLGPQANYFQEVEMTKEDQFDMYMKMKKEELVDMLIECNRILRAWH